MGFSFYPTCSIQDIATLASSLDVNPNIKTKEYDYIIVGGGTAGCVLANRLSENPNISVLLLERGPVLNTWSSRVPLFSIARIAHSRELPIYRWPSAPIQGAMNGSTVLIGGKVLGGTSKVNGFIYSRPFPGELDQWHRDGREGWSYKDLEPLFIRSETYLTHKASLHRGTTGPWQTQASRIFFNCTERLVNAAESLGFPFIKEANRPEGPVLGTVLTDRTVDSKGYRAATSDAFLPKSLVSARKQHLKICPNVLVTRISFEDTDSSDHTGIQARGVFLEPDSAPEDVRPKSYYVAARKEIILCAGAIASPQLLMLSGVGPRSHLDTIGISVVRELQGVGLHLQDHAGAATIFRVPLKDTLRVIKEKPLHALKSLFQYIFFKKGLFTAPLLEVTLYARSSLINDSMEVIAHSSSETDARNPDNIPDIEIMPTPSDVSLTTNHQSEGKGLFSLISAVLQPRSTGTVRLNSTDPRTRPTCALGLFQNPQDAQVLRKGVRLALRLVQQMREEGYEMEDVFVPKSESDEDIDEFALKEPLSTFHYTSTCRMALSDDPSSPGVVDNELRVYGIRGLRIADGSVFPNIPAVHTQAAIVVVAEKCADLIKSGPGWKD